jgi:hypothetical protein
MKLNDLFACNSAWRTLKYKENIIVKKLHSTDEAGGPHGQVVFNGTPIEFSFSAGHPNRAHLLKFHEEKEV